MSSGKTHTPGPWKPYFYVSNQRLKLGRWCLVGPDGFPIITDGVKRDSGNAEADARLAAAAPELLAALKEAADYLAEFFEEGRKHRVVADADAAIAKAEGRE